MNHVNGDLDELFPVTQQMHFDTIEFPVVNCAMLEPVYLEIRTQLRLRSTSRFLLNAGVTFC